MEAYIFNDKNDHLFEITPFLLFQSSDMVLVKSAVPYSYYFQSYSYISMYFRFSRNRKQNLGNTQHVTSRKNF